jgi:hypothetical protein
MTQNLVAQDPNAQSDIDQERRTMLRSGLIMTALAGSSASLIASATGNTTIGKASGVPFDYADPADNLDTLSRMWGVTAPGKLAYLYVFGPAFGMMDAENFRPLFRIESVAAVRTYPQGNGIYKYLAGQVILFTDWTTGAVLETFKNPLNNRVCEVFQYRDGPLDYTLDAAKLADRYTMASKTATDQDLPRKLVLDWTFRGDMAYGDAIVKTKLKNKLDPAVWKLESVGENWETFEAYRWQALRKEIEARGTTDIPSFTGSFQTFKPWEPWMLMGQTKGKIFSQRTAFKLNNLDRVPRPVMAYIDKNPNLSDILNIGTEFHGQYKLNDMHFKESRKPFTTGGK